MATETDHLRPHQACNNINRSFSSLSTNEEAPLTKSIPEILDHGSFSLGRYTADTLAWEKFSCFTHNRRQEELDKFREPGLVAQKKAYFEEYYRNIRALKGLHAEPTKQKGVKIHPFQDGEESDAKINHFQDEQGSIRITEAENGTESLPFRDGPGSNTRGENGAKLDSFQHEDCSISCGAKGVEFLSFENGQDSVTQVRNGAKSYHFHDGQGGIMKGENGAKIHPSHDGEGSIALGDICAIADRSNEETKSSNAGILQFSDDNLNSELRLSLECILDETEQIYINETMDRISTTDGSCVALPATIAEHSTKEATESIKSCSNTAHKGSAFCSKIKHSVSQLKKQAAAMWPNRTAASAAKKTKFDSRSKSSEKTNPCVSREMTSNENNSRSSGKGIVLKVATNINSRASSIVPHASLVKDKIMSRASSIGHNPAKVDSRPKGLAERFTTRTVSMSSRTSQTAAKPIHTVDFLRKSSRNERSSGGHGMKPVEFSDYRSPKVPKCERQSSKARSTNLLVCMKSNGNPGPDLSRMGSIRGGRKEKIINVNNAGLVRHPNHPVSPEVSGISKAPNSKSSHKIAQSRSVNLSLDRRFSRSDTLPSSRSNMPVWR